MKCFSSSWALIAYGRGHGPGRRGKVESILGSFEAVHIVFLLPFFPLFASVSGVLESTVYFCFCFSFLRRGCSDRLAPFVLAGNTLPPFSLCGSVSACFASSDCLVPCAITPQQLACFVYYFDL